MTDTAGRNPPVMPPGRELDALVAEKVMGHQWRDVLPQDGSERVRVLLDVGVGEMDGLWPRAHWRGRFHPEYSTSWDAMRLVVERLVALAWALEFRVNADGAAVVVWNARPAEFHATGDTAPHAVALAALKAVTSAQQGAEASRE